MNTPLNAHDLVWSDSLEALSGDKPSWLIRLWTPDMPFVGRRAHSRPGLIAVGARGRLRSERAALWLSLSDVKRVMRPQETLKYLSSCPWQNFACVQSARFLAGKPWPFSWGITGSTGFSLASGICAIHPQSDLDIVIRSRKKLHRAQLQEWTETIHSCHCSVDTQIDTGVGGFALTEWLSAKRVLLKTASGPFLTHDPWNFEEVQ